MTIPRLGAESRIVRAKENKKVGPGGGPRIRARIVGATRRPVARRPRGGGGRTGVWPSCGPSSAKPATCGRAGGARSRSGWRESYPGLGATSEEPCCSRRARKQLPSSADFSEYSLDPNEVGTARLMVWDPTPALRALWSAPPERTCTSYGQAWPDRDRPEVWFHRNGTWSMP